MEQGRGLLKQRRVGLDSVRAGLGPGGGAGEQAVVPDLGFRVECPQVDGGDRKDVVGAEVRDDGELLWLLLGQALCQASGDAPHLCRGLGDLGSVNLH